MKSINCWERCARTGSRRCDIGVRLPPADLDLDLKAMRRGMRRRLSTQLRTFPYDERATLPGLDSRMYLASGQPCAAHRDVQCGDRRYWPSSPDQPHCAGFTKKLHHRARRFAYQTRHPFRRCGVYPRGPSADEHPAWECGLVSFEHKSAERLT